MLNGEASVNGHGAPDTYHSRVEIHSDDRLSVLAGSLVQRALTCFDDKYGFSSASCQVYDTAWTAMVCRLSLVAAQDDVSNLRLVLSSLPMQKDII